MKELQNRFSALRKEIDSAKKLTKEQRFALNERMNELWKELTK